ncbi:uncharacterized protein LOC144159088 isoform X2 [Haemaphysalis longicornis]
MRGYKCSANKMAAAHILPSPLAASGGVASATSQVLWTAMFTLVPRLFTVCRFQLRRNCSGQRWKEALVVHGDKACRERVVHVDG